MLPSRPSMGNPWALASGANMLFIFCMKWVQICGNVLLPPAENLFCLVSEKRACDLLSVGVSKTLLTAKVSSNYLVITEFICYWWQ